VLALLGELDLLRLPQLRGVAWIAFSSPPLFFFFDPRRRDYLQVLALQVELCSPWLIASRVEARWRPSGFRPGFWPAGPVQPLYSSWSGPVPRRGDCSQSVRLVARPPLRAVL